MGEAGPARSSAASEQLGRSGKHAQCSRMCMAEHMGMECGTCVDPKLLKLDEQAIGHAGLPRRAREPGACFGWVGLVSDATLFTESNRTLKKSPPHTQTNMHIQTCAHASLSSECSSPTATEEWHLYYNNTRLVAPCHTSLPDGRRTLSAGQKDTGKGSIPACAQKGGGGYSQCFTGNSNLRAVPGAPNVQNSSAEPGNVKIIMCVAGTAAAWRKQLLIGTATAPVGARAVQGSIASVCKRGGRGRGDGVRRRPSEAPGTPGVRLHASRSTGTAGDPCHATQSQATSPALGAPQKLVLGLEGDELGNLLQRELHVHWSPGRLPGLQHGARVKSSQAVHMQRGSAGGRGRDPCRTSDRPDPSTPGPPWPQAKESYQKAGHCCLP